MESASESLQLRAVLDDMQSSIASARDGVQTLLKSTLVTTNFKDGISLFSLKNNILLFYLNSLVLLTLRRVVAQPLNSYIQPMLAFSESERHSRGDDTSALVDSMIEGRIVLEKIRVLEARMRYQVEKLIKIAREPETQLNIDDPLAFRPNPSNLLSKDGEPSDIEKASQKSTYNGDRDEPNPIRNDGIYHPPRVAPAPYVQKPTSKSRKEHILPSILASLSSDPSRPNAESTSGIGVPPSLTSRRAAYLKRLNEFEEENFSRVVLNKSETRKRIRDEEDLALGGSLSNTGKKHRSRAGGLEDEFSDILRSEGVKHMVVTSGNGDGYEELRKPAKNLNYLHRSRLNRASGRHDGGRDDGESSQGLTKRSRFELDAKRTKKKGARKTLTQLS